MPKHLTILEAQQQFSILPERLNDEPIITKDGLPVMAAIGYEQLMSLLETLEILSDNLFATRLKQSITQAEAGETIAWEQQNIKSVYDFTLK